MNYILIFFAASVLFLNCKRIDNPLIAENQAIDSFTVKGISDIDEFMTFHFNDTSAFSYSGESSTLYFYTKDHNDYTMGRKKELYGIGSMFHSFFVDSSGLINIINGDNEWMQLDDSFRIQKTFYFQERKGLLGDDYIITGLRTIPFLLEDKKLVSTFYYRTPQAYVRYFKMPSIAVSKIKNDSVYFANDYIPKPDNLIDYSLPFPKYCYSPGKILLVYPCFDTLYILDTKKGGLSKKVIANSNYTRPEKWDLTKMFTPEFNGYYTKYQLSNFQYKGVFYNPITKHYLLFYVTSTKEVKGRIASYEDQPLRLLVLDEAFKIQNYYEFGKSYFSPENFTWIEGKGWALPVFKNKFDFRNTTFYVYNF